MRLSWITSTAAAVLLVVSLAFGKATSAQMPVSATPASGSGTPPIGTPAAEDIRRPVGSLRPIGEQRIPNDTTIDGVPVGGLSGLDYDAGQNTWVIISDDRSEHGPARFYDATFTITGNTFSATSINDQVPLVQQDGTPFPNANQGGDVPDPESIRIDPRTGNLWWTSEGDQEHGIDPSVNIAKPDGTFVGRQPLPDMFRVDPAGQTGVRNNLAFEGLTFAPDGNSYWVSNEEALFQDGAPTTGTTGTTIRLTHYTRDGATIAQFAYLTDPNPTGASGKNDSNGVSEILSVDATRLLVMERGTYQDASETYHNNVRLYEVDTASGQDVSDVASLRDTPATPLAKTNVLTLDDTTPDIDNLEDLSWGPRLADGNPTLVLGSDNNFNDSEFTQFLAYEVLPTVGAPAAGTPAASTPVAVLSPFGDGRG